MNYTFSAPVTDAQRQRDTLLGALVGLARSTVNEPKTEDTDRILAAGLRLAADPEAAESALLRMTDIVEAEKHRVAPNCAACAMPCGNTSNYDLARLWGAPAEICALKVRLLSAVCVLAGQKTTAQIQKEICDDLFVLAEDWDTELLLPIVTRAEGLCVYGDNVIEKCGKGRDDTGDIGKRRNFNGKSEHFRRERPAFHK